MWEKFPKDVISLLSTFVVDSLQSYFNFSLVDKRSNICMQENEDVIFQQLFEGAFPVRIDAGTVLSLGLKSPWKTLLYSYLCGNILWLSNRVVIDCIKFLQQKRIFPNLKGIIVDGGYDEKIPDEAELNGIKENIREADVIIIHTDWPFRPQALSTVIGDEVAKAIENGTGVINTLYTGCSFYECLGGEYHKQNYHPIVPRVEVNNTPGSQANGNLVLKKEKIYEPEHFLFNGGGLATSTYACGTVNPKAKLLADLVDTNVGKEVTQIPGVVELQVGKSKILGLNAFFSSKNLNFMLCSILYAARKNFQD